MTPEEETEQGLKAIFDETASEPTHDQLNRMARAAARVPDTAPQPWFRRWRIMLPTAVAATAALAAAVFFMQPEAPAPDGPIATAVVRDQFVMTNLGTLLDVLA